MSVRRYYCELHGMKMLGRSMSAKTMLSYMGRWALVAAVPGDRGYTRSSHGDQQGSDVVYTQRCPIHDVHRTRTLCTVLDDN